METTPTNHFLVKPWQTNTPSKRDLPTSPAVSRLGVAASPTLFLLAATKKVTAADKCSLFPSLEAATPCPMEMGLTTTWVFRMVMWAWWGDGGRGGAPQPQSKLGERDRKQKNNRRPSIHTSKLITKRKVVYCLWGFFDVETGRQKTVQLINTATGCWRITFRSKFGKASLKSIAALVWNWQFTPACTLLSNALHRWEEKII